MQEAEELGKQRAAADFDEYQAAAAAATVMTRSAASDSGSEPAQAAAVQQQRMPLRPTSARQRTRQAARGSTAGIRAVTDPAPRRDQATRAVLGAGPMTAHAARSVQPQHAQHRGHSNIDTTHMTAAECEVISQRPDQAMAAAAAVEAAKLNVWKAEVMGEIEGLKLSLQGATAERHR